MLEEDREALRRMKADFEAIAELTESEFTSNTGYARRMNHYSTVYTAATRTTNVRSFSDAFGYYVDELLYTDFQEMLTRYLLKYCDLQASSQVHLFGKILKLWDHYKVLMKWNMGAFAYLSRFYIVNCAKPSLQQVALNIFLEQVVKKNVNVISRVTQDLLCAERNGEAVNRDQIRGAIELLSSVSGEKKDEIFLEPFLKPYVARTRAYYEGLIVEWSKSSTPSELLRQIEQAHNEERSRCTCYFSPEDGQKIMTNVEEVLLESPMTMEKLLKSDSGFITALRSRDEDLLKLYYNLLSCRTKSLVYLSNLTRDEIIAEGKERLLQHDLQKEIEVRSCVADMLQLQDDFMQLLSRCFQGHAIMLKSVRGGLEKAFSGSVHVSRGPQRLVPFSELLACYVDAVIQGNEGATVEEELERAVAALSYVTDRDTFLAHSRELLAQRILFPRKKIDEVTERSLIQRVSQCCGVSSTSCLEGMLYDVNISEGFGATEKLEAAGEAPSFTFNVLVLKKGIWPPRIQSESFMPPRIIQQTLRAFQRIYLEGTTGRVLTWSYSNSNGDVRAVFKKGVKILSMTGLQCWVVLAFNDVKELTLNDLMNLFGVSVEDARPVLLPLLKCSILRGESGAATIQPLEKFCINENFSSKWKKVRVPMAPFRRDGLLHSEAIAKEVEEDRRPAIDACLVRIMKSRRVLSHSSLLEECQQKLSHLFSADPKFIKQRIEELIRKEYIERDQNDPGVYQYTA
ncbi:cullin [Trypanosoma rangeli]|uniref:Cullin n=1 Tax=Trypanosoma rangeli TaxID=5698 RepID=A0A3R7K785_TRYRA|nr:cullin [Trypanosoma rangeli]RNF01112.1 cullin [Trypanosoma rangeli]|eukprot:RNF01112.1 cullin [Trypanosoma rangeli]